MRAKLRPPASSTLTLALMLAVSVGARAQPTGPQAPPAAPVRPVVDKYYGTSVSDPYRYMENTDDPAVQAWMKSQNDYTRAMLARIPGRHQLLSRIEELDNSVPRIDATCLPGNLCIVVNRLPGEQAVKLYRRTGPTGPDTLLVDPQKIQLQPAAQSKGANTLAGWAVSRDNRYLAVGVIPGGSELDGELHVIEIASGRETGDVIRQIGAEAWWPTWMPDNRSFTYGHIQKKMAGAPPTRRDRNSAPSCTFSEPTLKRISRYLGSVWSLRSRWTPRGSPRSVAPRTRGMPLVF